MPCSPNNLPLGGHLKPTAQKYPWNTLRVGESALVRDVPSAATVYASLKSWRDRTCFRLGLGYTQECCPQFSVAYDRITQVAEITRLHDGPMRKAGRHRIELVAQASDPQAKERAWLRARLQERRDERDRGHGGLTPLDIVERARAFDPVLAQAFADLDCGPLPAGVTPAAIEHERRIAVARQANEVLSHPMRRHDDTPDNPYDRHLAYRLARRV